MRALLSNILGVLAILAIGVWLGIGYQKGKFVKEVEIVRDTIVKTVKQDSIVYKQVIKQVKIPSKIDTLAVVKSYYTSHKEQVSFKANDVKITFDLSTYKNKGTITNATIQNFRATKKIEYKEIKGLFFGFDLGSTTKQLGLDYVYKKYLYSINYDLNTSDLLLGFKFKLF